MIRTKKVAKIKTMVRIKNRTSTLVVADATGRKVVKITKNITIVRSIIVMKPSLSPLSTGRKM